jgi:hypothetical protein
MDVLTTGPAARPPTEPDDAVTPRILLWILGGIVLLGLVVAIVLGTLRQPAPLGTDTPEGVVQAYVQYLLDSDVPAARELLSDEVADACSTVLFRQAWIPDALTVTLDEVKVTGDEGLVEVRMRTAEGPPPFGAGGYTQVEVFELERQDGDWRISAEPWPVYECGRLVR